jgi:hypothetical protein
VSTLCIGDVGVCAPGLVHWAAARPTLAGETAFVPSPVPRLAAAALPATERRRANVTARWALEAASDAVRALPKDESAALATVFASGDGDGEVLATVLRDLAQHKVNVSPTTFHNSVFNAPGGYWSIAAQSPAASTTVCAGAATFAAGLIEALTQVTVLSRTVLLVAFDHPFPAGAPIGTPTREPFACALLLSPSSLHGALARIDGWRIEAGAADALPPQLDSLFGGNPAAAALPLLAALACGTAASVALPYLDDARVVVDLAPCG